MEMLFYLLLAVVLYGLMADRTDQAIEREMRKRRVRSGDLSLVEDPDAGLDLHPRDHWFVRRLPGLRAGLRTPRAEREHRWRGVTQTHHAGTGP